MASSLMLSSSAVSSSASSSEQNSGEANVEMSINLDRNACLELIKSCKALSAAKNVHARVQHMLDSDAFMANKLLEMYGKCGSAKLARQVFDGITSPPKDCFSWVLMLCAYAQNGHLHEAKNIFDGMPERNLVSWTAMLVAYAQNGHLPEAKQVFDEMPEYDLVSWIAMLAAYARSRHLEEAKHVFDGMQEWNLVSWNAMLSAYAQSRHLEEAKHIFNGMPERDTISWNAMLAAYAQNGHPEQAKHVFDWMPERDMVSWTSLLSAYAHIGHTTAALELFHLMNLTEVPDEICFICVLLACSHAGQVHTGWSCFVSMSTDYNTTKPRHQHYSCMISLLGRAGYLVDAEDLINNMPYLPDALDWRCLLGSHRDAQRGRDLAAQHAVDLDPRESGSYVLLSHIWRKNQLL